MKFLILALSGGAGGHSANEQSQRETWASRLPEFAEIYWLKGNSGKASTFLDPHLRIINTPVQETYGNLLSKTVEALSFCLQEIDFTHILRTNTSCYFAPELLKEELSSLPNESLYGGVQGNYKEKEGQIDFISGAGIWMTRDVAEKVVQIEPEKFENYVDDVAIGKFLNGIPRYSISRQDVSDFQPLRPGAHSRVKHWRKDSITVSRMHNLDKIYRSKNPNELKLTIEQFDDFERNLANKNIRLFRASREIKVTQSIRIKEFAQRLNFDA